MTKIVFKNLFQIEKLIPFVLYLIIGFLPILLPFSSFGYESSKVLAFYLLTTLVAILWMILSFFKEIKVNTRSLIFRLATLFLIGLTLSSLLGISPQDSLLGRDPYYQGLFFYAYLYLFFLIISSTSLNLKTVKFLSIITSLGVSFWAIKDWVLINLYSQAVQTYDGRVTSTFGQPNFYAGFLLINLPFLIDQTKIKNLRWFSYLVIFLSISAILISQSRAAILIMIGFGFFLTIKNLKHHSKKYLAFAGLLLVFLTASFIYLNINLIQKEWSDPNNLSWLAQNSPEKRIFIWPVITNLVWERSILGYGLENLTPVYTNYFNQNLPNTPQLAGIKNLIVDRSHNFILDLAFFGGLVALFIWLGLIATLLKSPAPKSLKVMLCLYLIWIQFQNQSAIHLIYFWLIAALISNQAIDS